MGPGRIDRAKGLREAHPPARWKITAHDREQGGARPRELSCHGERKKAKLKAVTLLREGVRTAIPRKPIPGPYDASGLARALFCEGQGAAETQKRGAGRGLLKDNRTYNSPGRANMLYGPAASEGAGQDSLWRFSSKQYTRRPGELLSRPRRGALLFA